MRIEPKQAFYNEDTGAVQPWKDIEVTDTVGSALVAEGLVTEIEGGGGSSDFSTATVTSINNTAGAVSCVMPHAHDEPGGDFSASNGEAFFEVGTMTTTAILYKGQCIIYLPWQGHTIAISGNIEDDGGGYYIITGDCTITIS